MRALGSTLSFLIVAMAIGRPAQAHVPLFTPRVSLSLAVDWNKLALQALHHPAPAPATVVAHWHQPPRLEVANGPAVAAAQPMDVAAVSKVELYTRAVIAPSYQAPPALQQRRLLRSAYLFPFTPYIGCYGMMLTVQSDALLR